LAETELNKTFLLAIGISALLVITGMYFLGDTRDSRPNRLDTAETSPLTPRPNIVILIADDMGWNDLGAYGNPSVHTPNIDRLAANGLRFDNAFLTTSSCSASRASILTGKYPHSNGLVHLHQALPADEITVAQLLGRAGYHTEAVGKWHLGPEILDHFSNVIDERTDTGTEQWVERLRQRPSDKPFFYWLASRDPHRPHEASEQSVSMIYDPDTLAIPAGFVDGPGTRKVLANYYREVTRFDHDVGRVVAELEHQGVLDNTLIIVMSDNGRPFQLAKETLYDDGIKTPLIVHWPRTVPKPEVRKQLISSIDLAPTLLELAGLPVSQGMQGYSFASVLTNPERAIREYVFAERNWHSQNYHERAVRSLKYLYKENQFPFHGLCNPSPYQGKAYLELRQAYDAGLLDSVQSACFAEVRDKTELLAVDENGYAQLRNLADASEHADALETLSTALGRWRRETGDFDYVPYDRPQ
jgi:N-sulfoglucosamine sulfohydrolase